MKLLLDTNVLIDYYSRRQPFFDSAVKLRVAALFGDVELWAAGQSFSDIEYILRRAIPVEQLRSLMAESLEFLSISAPSSEDYKEAFVSGWPNLEDFIIARCAQRIKADYIITRDAKGFAQGAIPALTPGAFFELLKEEFGIDYDLVDFPLASESQD